MTGISPRQFEALLHSRFSLGRIACFQHGLPTPVFFGQPYCPCE